MDTQFGAISNSTSPRMLSILGRRQVLQTHTHHRQTQRCTQNITETAWHGIEAKVQSARWKYEKFKKVIFFLEPNRLSLGLSGGRIYAWHNNKQHAADARRKNIIFLGGFQFFFLSLLFLHLSCFRRRLMWLFKWVGCRACTRRHRAMNIIWSIASYSSHLRSYITAKRQQAVNK